MKHKNNLKNAKDIRNVAILSWFTMACGDYLLKTGKRSS